MNVAIFGGTFDPVHRGHVAVARAAQRAFNLGRVYFVPADIPPHKRRVPITAFEHRYAMLALALRDEPDFIPSVVESRAGAPAAARNRPNYTIDTVRRFRAMLPKRDRLYFLIGMDAFADIATWYRPRELMREVEFIVVSRPGFSLADLQPRLAALGPALPKSVHLLEDLAEDVASRDLRAALAAGRSPKTLLDEAVIGYIGKEHLYSGRKDGREPKAGLRVQHSALRTLR